MLAVAARMGAETCLRDPEFATDSVPMSDVYAHMASKSSCDQILLAHVTNPLAGPAVYKDCLEAYLNRGADFDSLTTVSDVKDFLYLDGKALNYDPACKPRSQDLPDILKLTHVASIASRSLVIEKKDFVGRAPKFLKLTSLESIDIDTELDFEIAEYLYERHSAAHESAH
jgi:N-acylneuraminate cytidylyltransferase